MRAYVNVETVLEDYVRVAHFVPILRGMCVEEELSVGFESIEMMVKVCEDLLSVQRAGFEVRCGLYECIKFNTSRNDQVQKSVN
jgi:hypothetical protein